MMQIQVQANKVALEVAHLQEFLNHWGNAPYTIVRVPLDALINTSAPRGHRQMRNSSGRRSHTLHSQASRHRSSNGGDDGWRRRSISPPVVVALASPQLLVFDE